MPRLDSVITMANGSSVVCLNPSDIDFANAAFKERFAALFEHAEANRGDICLVLAALTRYVAGGITVARRSDRDDILSDALLHVIRCIPKYRPANGAPFEYFRTILNNKLCELSKRRHRQTEREVPIESVSLDGLRRVLFDPMEAFRRGKAQRTFRLTSETDQHTTTRLLDSKIAKLTRAYADAESEAEQHLIRAMVLAIQDVRSELLGSFKRVQAQGLEYRKDRRMHAVDRKQIGGAHGTRTPEKDQEELWTFTSSK